MRRFAAGQLSTEVEKLSYSVVSILSLADHHLESLAVNTLPELGYIVILLGIFLGSFIVSNVTARGAGYKE